MAYTSGDFFFFINNIDRKGTTSGVQGGSLYCEKNNHFFQGLGLRWRYLWRQVLREWRLYVTRKSQGREFYSLEVIGIMASAFFRIVSSLIAKGCWMFEIRVLRSNKAFGGIIEFLSSEQSYLSYFELKPNYAVLCVLLFSQRLLFFPIFWFSGTY